MKLRLQTLCLAFISIPFLISTTSFAHGSYDAGYEDGYDDAMDDCPCPPGYGLTSGFYLGAGAGYEGYQISRSPWIDDNHIGSFNTHANGWDGRVFGGYGRYWNNYYLAGEGFVGSSSASGRDNFNVTGTMYSGKVSVDNSYGISVLPGYRIGSNGPLTYLRVGYINTEFNVNENNGSTYTSTHDWTSGFNTGIGVEIPLYKNWSGRLEYTYTNYSNFDNNSPVGSNNSPSDNGAMLNLKYNFIR